ncbi:FKBP-type peptidyl-prolyl cis-trans isomerase [Flavobacterium pectinovorum]|uniref:FKBP-type peptidyl-prolyl cis-trans isomerase n=1 Tax=Flavobacterium pectinovorum TaxID=29533 RepID=UPI001FACD41B|nr:FKBP-type peptidyl-prolyl cis-trans isomerase [Flavobacterium pectinovorum]MCI9846289.1 FKBP-type peptidyl-prolyl cis-trans isomerase [Flavobacterium pectinovorum]
MKKLLTALLTLTLFISCSSSDYEPTNIPPKDYSAENETEITDYLSKNNLTAQKTSTGLHYIITEEGTGKQPTLQSNVTFTYKGSLTDGTVFDRSTSEVTFPLSRLILGWQQGLPHFKEGGSGILFIPAHLGYGSVDLQNIPGGSVLIFEIKLITVN